MRYVKDAHSGVRGAKSPANAATAPAKRAHAHSPVTTRPATGRPPARATIKRAAADPVVSAAANGSSLGRMLAVLDLFDHAHGVRSVDEIGAATGYTRSTAYRYVGELADAGLLAQAAPGRYCLGPRIIQLDRQLRESDPLLAAMRAIEPTLPRWSREQLRLLCRVYRDTVTCIHQSGDLGHAVSFSRGYPMPLFRSATSKAILSFLHERHCTKLHLRNTDRVREAGLGASWPEFEATRREIRQKGYAMSAGEVDSGVFGIAAPIFGAHRRVIRSISVVRAASALDATRFAKESNALIDFGTQLSRPAGKDA